MKAERLWDSIGRVAIVQLSAYRLSTCTPIVLLLVLCTHRGINIMLIFDDSIKRTSTVLTVYWLWRLWRCLTKYQLKPSNAAAVANFRHTWTANITWNMLKVTRCIWTAKQNVFSMGLLQDKRKIPSMSYHRNDLKIVYIGSKSIWRICHLLLASFSQKTLSFLSWLMLTNRLSWKRCHLSMHWFRLWMVLMDFVLWTFTVHRKSNL